MTGDKTIHGATARALIRAADRATLATALTPNAGTDAAPDAARDGPGGGWPYASLVMVACDFDASPLLLISDLAEHTKNLAADGRASLMFDDTAGLDNPLTGARVTVLGRIERCDHDGARARYLARHPDAAEYAGFADFHLYRMAVERAHLVAGFGVIHWIAAGDVLFDTTGAAGLAAAEGDIVAHMNTDHADAVALYANTVLGRAGAGWTMCGIDPEGIDLRHGAAVARLEFAPPVATPITTASAARAALVALAAEARGGRLKP
jgi:putative heme iron utilization protein